MPPPPAAAAPTCHARTTGSVDGACWARSLAPGSPVGGGGRHSQRPGGTVFHLPSTPWAPDPDPAVRIKQETVRHPTPSCQTSAALQRRGRRRFSGHAAALRRARAGAPACNVSSACFFPRGKLDAVAFFSIVDLLSPDDQHILGTTSVPFFLDDKLIVQICIVPFIQ